MMFPSSAQVELVPHYFNLAKMVAIVDVAMLDELLDAHLACPGVLDDEVNSFACAQTRYHRKISLNLSDT
jgi:hypothetical protein